MIITTTDKYAKIQYGKESYTHALNTISYAVDENLTGLTLFRNNELLGTSPLGKVSVNGTQLTADNIDELLSPLFSGQGESIELPISMTDVDGLQHELNERPKDFAGATYHVDFHYTGDDSTGSPLKPFNKVQDAIDSWSPATDTEILEIKISPYGYYWFGEPDIIVNKRVSFVGTYESNINASRIGNVTVTSTFCGFERMQMSSLTVDNKDCNLTMNDCFISKGCTLKNIYRANIVNLNNNLNYITVQNLVSELALEQCDNLYVDISSGFITARRCSFGHADLNTKSPLILRGSVNYVSLKYCDFSWYNTTVKKFVYYTITNTSTKGVIYAFNSDIGEANRLVPRIFYIDNKQNKLVEGDNITLIPNADGTATIAADTSGYLKKNSSDNQGDLDIIADNVYIARQDSNGYRSYIGISDNNVDLAGSSDDGNSSININGNYIGIQSERKIEIYTEKLTYNGEEIPTKKSVVSNNSSDYNTADPQRIVVKANEFEVFNRSEDGNDNTVFYLGNQNIHFTSEDDESSVNIDINTSSSTALFSYPTSTITINSDESNGLEVNTENAKFKYNNYEVATIAQIPSIVTLSQSEYDELTVKDPNTFYYVY